MELDDLPTFIDFEQEQLEHAENSIIADIEEEQTSDEDMIGLGSFFLVRFNFVKL